MELIKVEKSKSKILKQDKKKRVVAYVRVSSEVDQSIKSFDNQKKYYLQKISNNENWDFAGIYSDEGISGMTSLKRKGFLKMLVDAENGKFDLILTKSISRFARNTLDTLKYVRILKQFNVGIIFEEENINTLDMQNELILSILGSVAQQEVVNLSTNIKYGMQQKMKEGKPTGFKGCYGYKYDYEEQEFIVIPEEAEVIRSIFDMYVNGSGVEEIKQKLNDSKIPTKTNNEYWRGSIIMKMLKNEKYTGNMILGKYCTINQFEEKKVINNKGESNKYLVKNNHDPIISKEQFDKVQEIIKKRYGDHSNHSGSTNRYCFSHHLRCGLCGYSLQRSILKYTGPYYRCVANEKVQKNLCNESKTVKLKVLEDVFAEMLKKYKKSKITINNQLVKTKLNYFNKYLSKINVSGFNEDIFDDLIHVIIYGRINELNEIETHSFRFIVRTNQFIYEKPTRDEILNHNYYKVFEYRSEVKTNWREQKSKLLHRVDNMYVSVEVDMDGDF